MSGAGSSYRHPVTLLGLPLVAVASGRDPRTGQRQVARGVIAIGQFAVGLIALGQVAVGVFALGQLALGLVFALGQGALGWICAGQGALAVAVGAGQLAAGQFAAGQLALGGNVAGASTVAVSRGLLYLLVAVPWAVAGVILRRKERGRLEPWAPLLWPRGERRVVEGQLRVKEPVHSPLDGRPCAWYRVRLVAAASGKTLAQEERHSAEWTVDSNGSAVRVLPNGARPWTEARWVGLRDATTWLQRHADRLSGGAVLVAEEWLPLDARVRVSGSTISEADPEQAEPLSYRETATRLCFAATERMPLLVTSWPLRELAADLRLGLWLSRAQLTLAGLLAFLGALALTKV